jgi:hypothetical protein
MEAYLGCPLKYRFLYLDRIPLPSPPANLASFTPRLSASTANELTGRDPTAEQVAAVFAADRYAQNLDEGLGDARPPYRAGRRREAGARRGDPSSISSIRRPERSSKSVSKESSTPSRRVKSPVELKTAARAISASDVERHLQILTCALAILLLRGRRRRVPFYSAPATALRTSTRAGRHPRFVTINATDLAGCGGS